MLNFSPVTAHTHRHRNTVDPIAFDCVKLIIVREGSARLFSSIDSHHVKSGDVILVAAHALLGAEPDESITTTTIYLDQDYVVDQLFWQYAAQFCDRHNARTFFDIHYSKPAQVLRLGEECVGMLMPWLDELVSLSAGGSASGQYLRTQALLFSTLDQISRLAESASGSANSGRSSTKLPSVPRHREFKPLRAEAQRAAQLFQDDPARQWTVSELSKATHLSPSQFRRIFVEAFGKAPIAYLAMVRVERMEQLLRFTNKPITQIASEVGWGDPGFATRQFYRSLGATPSAYRCSLARPDSC